MLGFALAFSARRACLPLFGERPYLGAEIHQGQQSLTSTLCSYASTGLGGVKGQCIAYSFPGILPQWGFWW